MKFTKKVPTKSGLYWVSIWKDSRPEVAHWGTDRRRLVCIGDECDFTVNPDTLWGDKVDIPTMEVEG